MDEQSHRVPYDLELPAPIMFWEPLEFVLALCLFGFGILTNLWVLGIVLGSGVLFGARYLKRGAKRGAMQHYLWSLGLQMDPALSKRFPPSWSNDYVE